MDATQTIIALVIGAVVGWLGWMLFRLKPMTPVKSRLQQPGLPPRAARPGYRWYWDTAAGRFMEAKIDLPSTDLGV